MSIVSELKRFSKMTNIAEEADLSKDELDKIALRVRAGYDNDLSSCAEWLADIKKVEELVSLMAKKKNKPLPNSANIKYPLITSACYQFVSSIHPEILKDDKVVKTHILGLDLDGEKKAKAERVADYMNYQLLFENEEWERDLDILLMRVAMIGFICKKNYFDPVRKEIREDLCNPCDLIINSEVKTLKKARRVSHVIHVYLNDLVEAKNSGVFLSDPIDDLIKELEGDNLDPCIDIIEQHCFLDLDGDKYAEPYIVTILEKSNKILRIAPRFHDEDIEGSGDNVKYITPVQLFTDYHFLVNPKGKFQSVGFGILMLHLNETINSLLNILLDAGQLANLQGGYKDARLKNIGSGDSLHDPGEWKTVKAMAGVTLKDGMVPINYKEPSETLFKLLGLLIQTGKDLSSSTEVMTGATPAANAKTGAVQALQQEGRKGLTSIMKRFYRSLTNNLRNQFDLDARFLDPEKYFLVENDKKAIKREDFDRKHVNVLPVADPNLSSAARRAEKNQIWAAISQLKGVDPIKCTAAIIDNSDLGTPSKDIMLPASVLNRPDPAMLELQAKIEDMGEKNKLKGHELQIRENEFRLETYKVEAQISQIKMQALQAKSQAILNLATAENTQNEGKFRELELQLDILSKHLDTLKDAAQFKLDANQQQIDTQQNQQDLDQQGESIDNDKQAAQQQANQGMAGASDQS